MKCKVGGRFRTCTPCHRLTTNDDISMRILELQTEQGNRVAAGTVKRLVGERNHRLEEWQTRWDEIRDALDTILIERGEELGNCVREGGATIAGGSTGFIVWFASAGCFRDWVWSCWPQFSMSSVMPPH